MSIDLLCYNINISYMLFFERSDFMDSKKNIGQRINSALALRNIKQKDLAKILNIPDNTISYFVSGTRTPNTEQLIKISRALEVSTDYLLGISENKSLDMSVRAIGDYTGLSDDAIENIKKICSNEDREYINKFFESPQGQQALINIIVYLKMEQPSDKIIATQIHIGDEDTTLDLTEDIVFDYVLNTITSNIKAVRTGAPETPIYQSLRIKSITFRENVMRN